MHYKAHTYPLNVGIMHADFKLSWQKIYVPVLCFLLFFSSADIQGQVPRIISDINPANGESGLTNTDWGTFEKAFVELNGIIYFIANDGVSGSELWRTDGSTNGTYQLKDITPGPESTIFQGYILAGNQIYFQVYENFSSGGNRNIWRTDGSPGGTYPLTSFSSTINNGEKLYPEAFSSTNFKQALLGNTLFFITEDDKHKYRLRKTDGLTPGSSIYLETTNENGFPFWRNGVIESVIGFRDKLLIKCDTASYINNDPNGSELYWTDGALPPVLYCDYSPGPANSDFTSFVNVNDFFLAFRSSSALFAIRQFGDCPELIAPLYTDWNFYEKLGNRLFFRNTLENNINEPYRMFCTDGSVAGTVASDLIYPRIIGSFNEHMLFGVGDRIKKWNGITPTADWFLDSTAAGTGLSPGQFDGAIQAGDRLILTATINSTDQMRITDGTNYNYYRLNPPSNNNFRSNFGRIPYQLAIAPGNKLIVRFRYVRHINYYTLPVDSGFEIALFDLNSLIWTGKNSTSWEDPLNWWPNRVPTLNDPVFITLSPRYPIVSDGTRYAKEVTIGYGNLEIGSNAQLVITK